MKYKNKDSLSEVEGEGMPDIALAKSGEGEITNE